MEKSKKEEVLNAVLDAIMKCLKNPPAKKPHSLKDLCVLLDKVSKLFSKSVEVPDATKEKAISIMDAVNANNDA